MKKAISILTIFSVFLFISCKDEHTKPYNYRDDIVGTYRGELKTANYTTGEVTITNPVVFVEAFTGNAPGAEWLNDSIIHIKGDIDPTAPFWGYKLEKNYTFGLGYFSQPDSLTFRSINSITKRGYFYKLKKQ